MGCKYLKIVKNKKTIIISSIVLIMIIGLFLNIYCAKTNIYLKEFRMVEKNNQLFHKIEAAEKINNGILYYNDNNILYTKEDITTKIADKVQALWRENNDLYYTSNNVLYCYNFETKGTEKIIEKPYHILGKYNGNIITYHGRNIYSINEGKKIKIFENGHYLNKAVLYKNKVYGIPAKNVYEYNLDTLEVNKITTNKHDMSNMTMLDNQLYIYTIKYKNENRSKSDYTYFKVTPDGLEKDFIISNINHITGEKNIQNGIIISTQNNAEETTKNNKLLYIANGKVKTIDKNYSYEITGLFDKKLLYYKNNHAYGTEQKNLNTFYLYDGKKSSKAFDLNVGFYENIKGYEYEGGIIVEVNYESSTKLYKYDGIDIKKIDIPSMYRISALTVIDENIYIRYIDGEESMESLGIILSLK